MMAKDRVLELKKIAAYCTRKKCTECSIFTLCCGTHGFADDVTDSLLRQATEIIKNESKRKAE